MFDYANFSKNIKFYRQELGYSQEMFAEKIGIAYKYLSEIERGISKPSISTVINILNGFHLTLEEYLSKNLKNETISKNIEIQKYRKIIEKFRQPFQRLQGLGDSVPQVLPLI